MNKEYYNKRHYIVFENSKGIIIFKKFIFGLYYWYACYIKDYFKYDEDDKMIIIIERPNK